MSRVELTVPLSMPFALSRTRNEYKCDANSTSENGHADHTKNIEVGQKNPSNCLTCSGMLWFAKRHMSSFFQLMLYEINEISLTWSGMTIMKSFFSRAESKCLMKDQPAPTSRMVTNSSVPFILKIEVRGQ